MPSDEEVTQCAGSLRSMTGLTEAECMALLLHFEQALVGSMPDRTMAGQPRTSRRYRTDARCPRPTTADTRLFILTDVQQHPSQAGQGQLLGLSPSHANTWMPLRHAVLTQAVADPARLPARPADDWAARLTTPPTKAAAPAALFCMTGPHDPSNVRKTRRHRKRMRVGRRHATRAQTAS
jgi:hypothetical protein